MLNVKQIELLKNISLSVSRRLHALQSELSPMPNVSDSILFPAAISSGKKYVRISEQEARFLFASELEKVKTPFSVETPTVQKYNFKSTTNSETSGSIDLSLYEVVGESLSRFCNVEFKAHTTTCKTDFEKLLRESVDGCFFHTLQATDSGTLTVRKNTTKGLLAHYLDDLKSVYEKFPATISKEKSIAFSICSLQPKFLLFKVFHSKDIGVLDSFFSIKYKILSKKIEISDLNGWELLIA